MAGGDGWMGWLVLSYYGLMGLGAGRGSVWKVGEVVLELIQVAFYDCGAISVTLGK
jgi:hypothetical protein